jgi:BirA family transcriptional regulator, biotin operon repressor / biotin---[acetyl-CoA-carboxylase] ligase
MSIQLLDALRLLSSEDFVSGAHLASRLGCSRASVHNLLKGADALGLEIHAVQGRGYRLTQRVDWLDADYLARHLEPLGMAPKVFDHLPSTNTHLMDAARTGAEHRTVAIAEFQSEGRGRRGRHWLAPAGLGLTFSLLWRTGRPAAELSGLSLAVGVMLVSALRDMGVAGAVVKWPNDILVAGAKLGGVLIELSGEMLGPSAAVIGVGLNVRGAGEICAQVDQAVTDLAGQGVTRSRNEVLLALLVGLNEGLVRFEQVGFSGFMADWNACHAFHGQYVEVLTGQGERIGGRAEGVDESGALLLRTASGLSRFHSGEVSLRGVRP